VASQAQIDAFLAERRVALLGASRSGKRFGATVLRSLIRAGHEARPVHPEAETLEGLPCVPSLSALAGQAETAVLVVPPAQTLKALEDAASAGIRRLWLQPGAESPAVLARAEELGLEAIHGHCILMFLGEGAWIHRAHRRIEGWLGRLPE
jgi:uncharacterized protein